MKTITYIASKENGNGLIQANFTYAANNLELEQQKSGLGINDFGEAIFLPVNIFTNGISGLEAISKYLKENSKLKFCQIAKLLNRDDRTIWDAYHNAKLKSDENFAAIPGSSCLQIPLQIFNDRTLSVLETLTSYLKEELNLRYCQIASLLNKDARTIWTVYSRAKKKNKKNKNA